MNAKNKLVISVIIKGILLLVFILLLTKFTNSQSLNQTNISGIPCNPMLTSLLKEANFNLQQELEQKDEEIRRLEGYRLGSFISWLLTLIVLSWTAIKSRKLKKEHEEEKTKIFREKKKK